MVYSFDVFDTCVTRSFACPRDLFYTLGHRLAPQGMDAHSSSRFAARFQQHRIRAEKKAHRHAARSQSVTINDIYSQFRPLPGLQLTTPQLVESEIAFERESLYAIPGMLAWLQQLRDAGHRIIFISDMYLPATVLRPILCDLGVMQPGESLYVSCDIGCSKRDGKIFRHVLRAEGIQPTELVHHGDNLIGDVRMPRQYGIEAHHVTDGALSSRERRIAGEYSRRQFPRPSTASFLAGFARRLRLEMTADADAPLHPLDPLLQTTIVPFLLAYVLWVLDEARRHGVRRLYFVARDGEVLLRIARMLESDSSAFKLRYLYGSRRAWLPAAVDRESMWWRRSLTMPGQSKSAMHILDRLRLSASDKGEIRAALDLNDADYQRERSYAEGQEFIDRLMRVSVTAEIVERNARKLSKTVYDYFAQEGVTDDRDWALVDVGWSFNCQAALRAILRHHQPDGEIGGGYYVARARDFLQPDIAGPASSFVEQVGSLFARRAAVVEYCFFPATHASTIGYQRMPDDPVEPALGKDARDDGELTYVARLHRTAEVGARLLRESTELKVLVSEYGGAILAAAEKFLRFPDRNDAATISAFDVVVDMRHDNRFVKRMCAPLGVRDFWHLVCDSLPRAWQRSEHPIPTWVEGAAAISPWYTRVPTKALLLAGGLRGYLHKRGASKSL